MPDDKKIYVPRQKTRIGRASYQGKNIVIVDPDTGKQTPADRDEAPAKGKK